MEFWQNSRCIGILIAAFATVPMPTYAQDRPLDKTCAVEGFLTFDISMLRALGDQPRDKISETFSFLGPSVEGLIDDALQLEVNDTGLSAYQHSLTRMWDQTDECKENGSQIILSSEVIDVLYDQGLIAQQKYRALN